MCRTAATIGAHSSAGSGGAPAADSRARITAPVGSVTSAATAVYHQTNR